MDAFEISDTAALLLNRSGQVIRSNRSAEAMLGGDVRISGRRLVANDRDATAALDRGLHRLLFTRTAAALGPPIPLPRSGQRPLLVYPLKLPSPVGNAIADCQGIMVLIDPDKRCQPLEAALQASFGLTVAEARLAAGIASGESLDDITDRLGIAKETGRNQLKSIFQKIGVHRQAELVAMFARLLSADGAERGGP